ncbi:hypothetical protein HPB52_013351 [Rhipicephalus sanguineus]|uniref:Uncharacterized protein n=1 Tax=Rhipicephalus sanguineus TaxID=34632 RepID=A0A9D4PGM5_RHISA|nr:hypothetical protein HPB52_013351 [Rhipicephalus sanguineus]
MSSQPGASRAVYERRIVRASTDGANASFAILREMFVEGNDHGELKLRRTCEDTVVRGAVPKLSVTNCFTHLVKPITLPRLDEAEEQTVSPRIPFMNIQRLTHGYGHHEVAVVMRSRGDDRRRVDKTLVS